MLLSFPHAIATFVILDYLYNQNYLFSLSNTLPTSSNKYQSIFRVQTMMIIDQTRCTFKLG
jgi:hypothetical protein